MAGRFEGPGPRPSQLCGISWDFGGGRAADLGTTDPQGDSPEGEPRGCRPIAVDNTANRTFNLKRYISDRFPQNRDIPRFKISKIPHNYPRRSSGPTPATPDAAFIESAEIRRRPPDSTDVLMGCGAPLTRDAHRPRSRGSRHPKRPLPHNPTKSHTITRAPVCAAASWSGAARGPPPGRESSKAQETAGEANDPP